ncbi:hypothetical protein O0L34_g18443 [Tuta absoluta]|nr:hypothetical protein O0L34_g18443 [Tuta absoluta]
MKPAVLRDVKKFLNSTTLHGFKYMSSPFWIDRVWWLVCGCASACCAGVLCAVLLARFMQVPALLALLDFDDMKNARFPMLAICPSTPRVAQLFEQRISLKDMPYQVDLPSMFYTILRGKTLTPIQVDFLEQVLARHNMTLVEALFHVTSPCEFFLRICRWRSHVVPCQHLFYKEITEWGICCLTRTEILNVDYDDVDDALITNPNLDLLIQFSDNSDPNGFEFYTKYEGEQEVLPVALTRGYNYLAQLTYVEIKDSSKEKLIDLDCVSAKGYSAEMCMIKCKERQCRCSDPLTPLTNDDEFPDCTVREMNCLKTLNLDMLSCRCLPSCRKISTQTTLEVNPINNIGHAFDPIFADVNASSTVFSLRIRKNKSKRFDLMYNDTWWSLLSSLGGVFNMFLGVGIMSVIEVIMFLVRLPLGWCRATQLTVPIPSETVTEIH